MVAPRADPGATLARVSQSWDDVDVVIATSGSTTGRGHVVGLSHGALTASAAATHARFGGAGQWITSLPIHHIAGFQVVRRSALAGVPPIIYDGDPHHLDREISRMRADMPRYLSVVPTQLLRILETDPRPLTRLDAVLVGGAALPSSVNRRAHDQGVPLVASYGMTETSGGCVYDGVPLDGVRATVDRDGRIRIAGPTLATRYMETIDQPFVVEDGTRWLVTSDLAEWSGGRLTISGRADDVIISGGVNVSPSVVEAELTRRLGGVWIVVGIPDQRWGSLVVAVTENDDPLGTIRRATAQLPTAYRPRAVVRMPIPHLASGKVDRRNAAARAATHLAGGAGERRD